MFTFKPFLGLSGFQIIPNVQIEENQMNQMLIQQQERLYFFDILAWKQRIKPPDESEQVFVGSYDAVGICVTKSCV